MSEAISSHELARQLLDLPDLPCHIGYDYGNRTHTTAAPGITEVVEAQVCHSDYIQSDQVIENAEETDQAEQGDRDAIILTYMSLEV